MLAQDATGQEGQVTPDGPSVMSGVSIKRRPAPGVVMAGGWRVGHHQTGAASLLTLSLVGLVTSVLAAASVQLAGQSVNVVLRLPTSANLGT